MEMKMKFDINTLTDKIMGALNSSKSRYVKEYGFSIEIGLNLLLSYLKEIAKRALKIDDAVIMFALLNIGAIIPDSAEEEKEIHERAKVEANAPAIQTLEIKARLFKVVSDYYDNLDSLAKRLQDDYAGDKPFVQQEEDRLGLCFILDFFDDLKAELTEVENERQSTQGKEEIQG